MQRFGRLTLNVTLLLTLAGAMPQQAFQQPAVQAGQMPAADPVRIPLDLFHVPDGLEVTLFAASPMLHNPTNIDIYRDGRIWVAEGVRYRSLGCGPCTQPVVATAATVAEIIVELRSGRFANIAERSGRAQDAADGGGLETLRRDGYM